MKKSIFAAALVLGMVCGSQASLIGVNGIFSDSSGSFTYDGLEFQNGWIIRLYQTTSSTVDFSVETMDSFHSSTTVDANVGDAYVMITASGALPAFTDNSFVYSVLFNTAVAPTTGDRYLLLDTVAHNVGAYDPIVWYTPGHDIPYSGNVTFNGQTWQDIPAVPEPATMGLLGLGALVLALRRKTRA